MNLLSNLLVLDNLQLAAKVHCVEIYLLLALPKQKSSTKTSGYQESGSHKTIDLKTLV